MFGCVFCIPRLKLNEAFPEVFDLVSFMVDANLLQQWRQAAKSSNPINWCMPLVDELSLVMPASHMQKVVASPNDLVAAQPHMIKCIEAGSDVAHHLFSSSLVNGVMEQKVVQALQQGLTSFVDSKPADGAAHTMVDFNNARAGMLKLVTELGSGVRADRRENVQLFMFAFVVWGGWWD